MSDDNFRSDWVSTNYRYKKVREDGGVPVYSKSPRRLIVCLCGSTKFWKTFQEQGLRETLAGRIVLSIGAARCSDDDDKKFGGLIAVGEFDRVKKELDELHLDKIDLADQVLVLNVGGYVGESTGNEVRHAIKRGKVIRWLEPDKIPPEFAPKE